jgi:mono/diheme cytochrome c family protein
MIAFCGMAAESRVLAKGPKMIRKITVIMISVSVAILAALTLSTQAQVGENSAGLYKAKCAVCHGATGKGDTPAGKSMGVPSFTDPAAAKSDAERRSIIEKGKNKMPAYGKSLKPEEIQGLVAYIRSLK